MLVAVVGNGEAAGAELGEAERAGREEPPE